jgi:hypothetical protein
VSGNELIEEYLTKAKEAEDQASRCRDRTLKESWQRIALSYREMAQRRLDGKPGRTTSEQPSQEPASQAKPSLNKPSLK